MTAPDVVVVGAGFAGLSAAAALSEAGARVLVLDARPQLGGRATAFVDKVTGELVDNGQHVLFGCYRETQRFLERIGAEGNVRRQPSLALHFVDRLGRRSALHCPPIPAPLHLLAGVLDWDALTWGDRLSVLRLAKPLLEARRRLKRTPAVADLSEPAVTLAPEGETVSAWLDRHRQARKVRQWLWEPLAVAALNQSPDEAAASPFVRVLAGLFGPDPADAAVVLPTVPLTEMYGEPARTYISARGGEVRSRALARVVFDNDAVAGVDVQGDRIPASNVIAAVPWFALKALVGGAAPPALSGIMAAADRMTSKPILTVNLWYDAPVLDEPFIGLPERTIQWVFDKRLIHGGATSHLSLVSSGAERLVDTDDPTLTALAAAEIEEALPAARRARLTRATEIREKRATYSLAAGEPARPGCVTPVRGLYLAGDWIDTGLPGTIESAVISGHMAARAAIESGAAALEVRR
jgi:squalene-associated FAD-dependent desaturase